MQGRMSPIGIPTHIVAKRLGVTTHTLLEWRRKNYGPPFTRVGRCFYYNEKNLSDWLSSQTTRPTALSV